MNISVVIIAKNAATTLGMCLESVARFDEVIVYNNDSTDDTPRIAQRYPNVRLVEGPFLGFGPTKNAAASYARHDWILSLDADEVLTPELVEEIAMTPLIPMTLYRLTRKNFYKTIEVRHCWGSDHLVRLYHRHRTCYSEDHVHEYIVDTGLTQHPLHHAFHHYPYHNMSDFILKLDRYSTLFATEKRGKKRSSPAYAMLNALYSFLRTYILKRGFLDGYAGLVIAFSHMATNFYKYMKLYEANQES